MKKLLFIIVSVLSGSLLFSQSMSMPSDVVLVKSRHDFKKTVERVYEILKEKELPVFADFDHEKNAKEVELSMPPSRVIVFGNPKAGTQIMLHNPLIAFELPMKIAVVEDKNKTVYMVYAKAEMLAKSYNMKDSPILKKMSALLKDIVSTVNK